MLKTSLLEFLDRHFNISALKTLCFELHIDYDNISGESKQDKARELILYLERNENLEDLYNFLKNKYGNDLKIIEELQSIIEQQSCTEQTRQNPSGK